MVIREKTIKALKERRERSAWSRGVREYALELLENVDSDDDFSIALNNGKLERLLLNGASSWKEYSWGGCALIYDGSIAARLCTPGELRRTENGTKRPNKSEDWLDVQARALWQAYRLIDGTITDLQAGM